MNRLKKRKNSKNKYLDNILPFQRKVSNTKSLKHLTIENNNLKVEHKELCEMTVRSILKALDQKDHYTYGHSIRVTFYSLALGREIGLNNDELYNLEVASLFHDIGKIAIPDSILLKPSRLNNDEFEIMKSHPVKTSEILSGFKYFEKAAKFAKHHHEMYNGNGYPDGLKGEKIPLFSRIILISDTFDAMTSTRPYRKALSNETAFAELRKYQGIQFDPSLVENFIRAMEKETRSIEETFELSIIEGEFQKKVA